MKKEEKKLKSKIDDILIDFGNHYIEATQGKKLDLRFYNNQILDLIEREKKIAELETEINARDFIVGCPDETKADLLKVFNLSIDDLKEELTS